MQLVTLNMVYYVYRHGAAASAGSEHARVGPLPAKSDLRGAENDRRMRKLRLRVQGGPCRGKYAAHSKLSSRRRELALNT